MAIQSKDSEFFTEAINTKIRQEAEKIFAEYEANFLKSVHETLAEKREQIIASIVLKLSRAFEISTQGEKITISVERRDIA